MKKLLLLILPFTILIWSCTYPKSESEFKENDSTFDLKKDILDFTSKMSDLDTVYIFADQSVCLYSGFEVNIITKKNGIVYIKTYADGDYMPEKEKELQKIIYEFIPNDTLNFENLFHYMQKKGVEDYDNNSAVFTVICKQDTLTFYSDGLSDHLDNLKYYGLIKRRLYPNANNYKVIEVTELEIVEENDLGSKSNFSEVVDKLSQLGYYKVSNFPDYYNLIDNGFCAIINPTQNSIRYIKEFEIIEMESHSDQNISDSIFEYIYPVKVDSSVIIKQFRLEKKLKTMSPSVSIEEWTFKTKNLAQEAFEQLQNISDFEWFLINKSSVSYWEKENRLYFIFPHETYVKYDLPQIRKVLEDNL